MKLGLLNLCLCFVIVICFSPLLIKWLKNIKFGQSILVYVEKHKTKEGTPTMGGIIFILASSIGYLVFFRKSNTLATIAIMSMLFFGLLGFLDDFLKIKFKQNEGLKAYQKFLGQLGLAIIISIFVYTSDLVGSDCYIPFTDITIDLGYFIIPLVVLFYVAVVNSVNLIDGLDGLCSGVSTVVIFVITIIVWIISHAFSGVYLNEINNIIIVSLGVVGALLGFMIYNGYPAKVFMGDTGSLAIGGFLASLCTFTKNYFLVIIVGFMFVLTTISVILQVVYYKATKKRLFKMSPLHHHFEQSCNESKVTLIYILVTLIIGILTIFLYL